MSAQDSKIRIPNLILIRSLFIITLFYCLRSTRLVFANGKEESFCEKRFREYDEDRREYRKHCVHNSGDQSPSCCNVIKESLDDRVLQYHVLCPGRGILGPNPARCEKMDIIFVVDRSGSIRPSDYDHLREFLKLIGKRLKIGEGDEEGNVIGQGAIVTFSEKGHKRITLKESQTSGKFERVVNEMPGPLPGGRTKTHRGLALADKEVAIKEAGLRVDDPTVEKIFMVITDGEQTRERGYTYVGDAIKPFFKRDMTVFAVGVGLTRKWAQPAIDQVKDMVEVPENAIFTKSFKQLTKTVDNLIKKFCPIPLICGSDEDDCHTFATCKDTNPGEYECKCNKGYVGDGKICKEIKICGTAKAVCHKFATCSDTGRGSYKCTCNEGYSGDGKTCTGL